MATKKKYKVTHVERGWPGHFCCSERCLFRRNTLIECEDTDARIVVSTVGLFYLDLDNQKFTEVGAGRYYETMAFHANWDGTYWDADPSKSVSFDSKWCLDHFQYGTDNEANEMHDHVVTEIYGKMLKGETFENQMQ